MKQSKFKYIYSISINIYFFVSHESVSPTLVIYGIIGDGTNRFVFEGTWKTKVAVKRIEIERTNAKEETALRQCDHPNVIKLLDVQSDENFK